MKKKTIYICTLLLVFITTINVYGFAKIREKEISEEKAIEKVKELFFQKGEIEKVENYGGIPGIKAEHVYKDDKFLYYYDSKKEEIQLVTALLPVAEKSAEINIEVENKVIEDARTIFANQFDLQNCILKDVQFSGVNYIIEIVEICEEFETGNKMSATYDLSGDMVSIVFLYKDPLLKIDSAKMISSEKAYLNAIKALNNKESTVDVFSSYEECDISTYTFKNDVIWEIGFKYHKYDETDELLDKYIEVQINAFTGECIDVFYSQ